MVMAEILSADPRWLAARRRLQDRYGEVSALPDASRLGYLQGPVQHFSEEEFAEIWARLVADPARPEEAQHSVYIHVPFCKSICSFCNYERLRPSEPGLLDAWLQRVLRSLDVVAPAVQPIQFEALYIGGGTPSTLTPRILSQLLEAVDSKLNWHPHAERAFEFDPAVMNAEKLAVLKRHGFWKFSFGIQTLDSSVNADHNRGPQSVEMVARRFEELQAAGISDVAADILLGLRGTSPEGILRDIETILERFRPLRLDVFMITPTHEYVDSHFGGDFAAFREHLLPFQEKVPAALQAMAERLEYQIKQGQGHRFQLKRIHDTGHDWVHGPKGSYQGMTSERDRPVQILGLGPSARSQLFGHAAVQTRDPGETPLSPGPALYEGHLLDRESEVRTYLVHRLRDADRIDRSQLRKLFGADITELIPAALSAWQAEDLVSLSSEAIELRPQSRQERIKTLLWLVPERFLEYELARRAGLDLSAVGVRGLLRGLQSGAELGPGVRLHGVAENGRVELDQQTGRIQMRVAPPLVDGAGARLVVEKAPSLDAASRAALSRAIGRLKAIIHRNQPTQSMR